MARKLTQWLPLFKVLHSRTRHLQVLLPVLLALVWPRVPIRPGTIRIRPGNRPSRCSSVPFPNDPNIWIRRAPTAPMSGPSSRRSTSRRCSIIFCAGPMSLVPLTAEVLPEIRYFGHDGSLLNEEAPAADVAYTDYVLRIRPGILYQPHPALAAVKTAVPRIGRWIPGMLEELNTLCGFSADAARVSWSRPTMFIRSSAWRSAPNHSPVASLMAEHIRGFSPVCRGCAERVRTTRWWRGQTLARSAHHPDGGRRGDRPLHLPHPDRKQVSAVRFLVGA